MEAVRVPPSAWITSQSTQRVRSPRRLHVDDRPQRAADEALDLVGAAGGPAPARLALAAGGGGAGQHAVLGGDPALALALQERGHPLLDAHGADDLGVADLDEDRAFRVLGVAPGEGDRPELVGGAAVAAHLLSFALEERRVDLSLEVADPEAHGRVPPAAAWLEASG